MKHWIVIITILAATSTAFCQEPGFKVQGQGSVTLPVTTDKMTNIVFPAPIQSAVKVSRDILAQKVRGVDNVIELKAVHKNFPPTNLSVYDRNGHLYSFVLKYMDDTPTLNYRITIPDSNTDPDIHLTGLPFDNKKLQTDAQILTGQRGFLHRSVSSGGLKFKLTGIWLKDSLQWFVFSLDNHSPIIFRPSRLRFYITDAEQVNRRAAQEWEITPIYKTGATTLPGRQTERFAIAFQPFTVPLEKRLNIEVKGQDGRVIVLQLKGGVLLRTH